MKSMWESMKSSPIYCYKNQPGFSMNSHPWMAITTFWNLNFKNKLKYLIFNSLLREENNVVYCMNVIHIRVINWKTKLKPVYKYGHKGGLQNTVHNNSKNKLNNDHKINCSNKRKMWIFLWTKITLSTPYDRYPHENLNETHDMKTTICTYIIGMNTM